MRESGDLGWKRRKEKKKFKFEKSLYNYKNQKAESPLKPSNPKPPQRKKKVLWRNTRRQAPEIRTLRASFLLSQSSHSCTNTTCINLPPPLFISYGTHGPVNLGREGFSPNQPPTSNLPQKGSRAAPAPAPGSEKIFMEPWKRDEAVVGFGPG